MTTRTRDTVMFAVLAVFGASVWLIVSKTSGRTEAWDDESFFRLAIPAMMVAAAIAGAFRPGRAVLWGLATVVLQPVAMFAMSGMGSLFVMGLFAFAIFGFLCAGSAFVGEKLRTIGAKVFGKEGRHV